MRRLAIWQDERLDRHVTQKQSTWFLFLSMHKYLCFSDWRSDLRSVGPYDFFLNKSSESTYVFLVKF